MTVAAEKRVEAQAKPVRSKRRAKVIAPEIERAMVCGHKPQDLWSWRTKPVSKLTTGEKVCRFALEYLRVPEGPEVGVPLELDPYQVAFILALLDGPQRAKKGILTIARRNGKSSVIAAILLAYIVGPLAASAPNSVVACAAMSRDQAALVFRLCRLMLEQSPELEGLFHVVPSSKRIIGLRHNVELETLSRDAKTGHGRSFRVVLVDEAAQIENAHDDYLDMLSSSQGSHEDAVMLIISTQAPSDSAFLSQEIDTAIRDQPASTVCHVYSTPEEFDWSDEKGWRYANPALGRFRSLSDMRQQYADAKRLPARQAGFLNLLLNRRIARDSLAFAPEVWKSCGKAPDLEVFRTSQEVVIGLDLSAKTDLTAAVMAARDADGVVHLYPWTFAPEVGLKERENRDKSPYSLWVQQGALHLTPGSVVDLDWVFQFLRIACEEMGVTVHTIAYDRWRINEAKGAAERVGFAQHGVVWADIGQGYVTMSPALEFFEGLMLRAKLRHGSHPLLNMAAATAVYQYDPAGNRKLTKGADRPGGYRRRIDPLVAAVMAVSVYRAPAARLDVRAMIG